MASARLFVILGSTTASLYLAGSSLAQDLPLKPSDSTPILPDAASRADLQQHLAEMETLTQAAIAPITEASPLPTIARSSRQAQDLLPENSAPEIPSFDLAQASETGETGETEPKTEPEAAPKRKFFSVYLGSRFPNPSALKGPTRKPIVPAADPIRAGIDLRGGGQFNFGKEQNLTLELRGGESVLGADLSYFHGTGKPGQGVAINIFNQRSFSPSFRGGDRDVELPGGEENPWVHRLGGGVEFRQPFSPKLTGAFGVNYQKVSVRDGIFSSGLEPFDEFGNRLTVSDQGQDDLLTLNAALQYDTRDNTVDPTKGTRLRFGLDQSLPIGDAEISMTRLGVGASQYIPLNLFGFAKGPRTFVLSLHGGHIFGDVPPYEAFSLGGGDTIRGFEHGGVGTGRSFIHASAEYRFPLFGIDLLTRRLDVRGVFFVDYGSTLGSQEDVIGQPGVVRDKPGDGVGGGVGVRINTGRGVARLEVGISEDGDFRAHFGFGERF